MKKTSNSREPSGLIKSLRNLTRVVNMNVRDVSSGGCGVYAACVGSELERLGVNVDIVIVDEDVDDKTASVSIAAARAKIKTARKKVNVFTWNLYGIEFGHVVVEFEYRGKRYWCDSNKVVPAGDADPTFGWRPYRGRMTVKEIKKIARTADGWNRTYDRSNNDTLRKIVKHQFSHVQSKNEVI